MEFEFDPAKDEANRFKHGLRLAFGMRVFDDDDHVVVASNRPVDSEDRFKAIGLVKRQALYSRACLARRCRQADLGEAEQCE